MRLLFFCFHILPIYVSFPSAFTQQQAWSVAERERPTCSTLLSLQYASIPWSLLSQNPSGLSLLFPFSLRAGMPRCVCVQRSYPFAGASSSTFTHLLPPTFSEYTYICFSALFQPGYTAELLDNAFHRILYCFRFPILSMLLSFSFRDNTFNLTISVVS